MNISRFIFLFTALTILSVCPTGFLYAEIANESNQSLLVEIVTKKKTELVTIYPNQSVNLPPDTVQLRVVPRASERGDEIVKLRVSSADGKRRYINAKNKILNLAEETKSEKIFNLKPEIVNKSNVAVNVRIINKKGGSVSARVLPEESLALAPDTVEVKVTDAGFMLGNESISVQVRLPNGQSGVITNAGASLRLTAEK